MTCDCKMTIASIEGVEKQSRLQKYKEKYQEHVRQTLAEVVLNLFLSLGVPTSRQRGNAHAFYRYHIHYPINSILRKL